ncbi:MAG TPA: DUF2723 domain-containing protein [Phycisphaerae bacterium]|nr:DUF2723 domain-containing protein [Phycisphaerae bacterium]
MSTSPDETQLTLAGTTHGPSIPAGFLLVFAVSLAAYAITANRGPQWQDSGQFILAIYTKELVNPLGLALSHPLHHWLGRAMVRLGAFEPAHAVTLVSSLGAAACVACVFGCVTCVTRSRAAGLFAAVSIGLAHTFWRLATCTEVYTLSAGLLAAECWCLAAFVRGRRREYLWAMLLFNGLGLANHMQAILTTPVLIVVALWAWRRKRIRLADILFGVMVWVIGSLPYTALVVGELTVSGDWASTLRSALLGESGRYGGNVLNVHPSLRILAVSIGFTILCFPNLLLPAAGVGLARAGRLGVESATIKALLAGLILHALFVCRYNVVDQHTFFLPTYVLLTIFGGFGAAWIQKSSSRTLCGTGWKPVPQVPLETLAKPNKTARRAIAAAIVLLLATPAFYAVMPAIARHFQVLRNVERAKPYRDDYVYIFSPWGVLDHSAQVMSETAVRLAGSDGLILVEDPMAMPAVEYQALRGGSSDIEVRRLAPDTPAAKVKREAVLSDAAQAGQAGRSVVLVPATLVSEPPAGLSLRREGDLYLIVGPAPGEAPG